MFGDGGSPQAGLRRRLQNYKPTANAENAKKKRENAEKTNTLDELNLLSVVFAFLCDLCAPLRLCVGTYSFFF